MVNEKCVLCGKNTIESKKENINKRIYYIEGSGQLCEDCFKKVYGSK